jgi:hypothetical protein
MNATARIAIAQCDHCDADTLRGYIRAGLVLVPIPSGSKRPRTKHWNERTRCWASPADVPNGYSGNVGLAHAYSGTCALDIDDMARADPALSACGIDLAALLAAPDAVHVRSGRPGRDKLLYRLPAGVTLASINRSAAEGFELRCAATNGRTVQDVLPPSIHPDTGKPYQWAGNWRAIPDAPTDLLAVWHRLLASLLSKVDPNRPIATVTRIPTARKRTLPEVIPEGERNATLLRLAAGFVRKGHGLQAVNDRLQRINAERCTPPLGADEVDSIAARAAAYGSDGFAMLPHKLLDSAEWKALPPAAHDVIVTAFRRYNGMNGDNIALTWADFEGREGFGRKDTFYRQRKRAVASGILQCASEGRNGQTGRKPDLFSIAPKFRQYRKCNPAPVSKMHTPT